MAELGVETQRLVMPTRNNLEALDGVLVAGAALCDMKRQVDRVEQDLRTLRAQREGYVAPLQSRGVCSVHTLCRITLMTLGTVRVGNLDWNICSNEKARMSLSDGSIFARRSSFIEILYMLYQYMYLLPFTGNH